MKKRKHIHSSHGYPHYGKERPIRWLPIDSRIISPIFKFGRVSGAARFFLELEITLAIIVVCGTLLWAGMYTFGMLVK